MRNRGHVGVAIIGAIAVLLILIGTTLSTISRMDAELSKRYLDQLRARVLAQNGLVFAREQLQSINVRDFLLEKERTWQYYGEDLDANGRLDKNEDQNNSGYLDTIECLLKNALRPSFTSEKLIYKSNGRYVGYSAESTASYSGGNDVYSLKVVDCNSQININATDNGTKQLLNNLGDILGIDAIKSEGGKKGKLGTAIYQARANRAKGFTTKEELQQFLPADAYNKIKDYVTLYARVDGKVIKPRPYSTRPAPLKLGQEIFAWSELNPGIVEIEPRAPININSASKIVLMAALANLEGTYLQQKFKVDAGIIEGGVDKPVEAFTKTGIGVLSQVTLKWPEDRKSIEMIADRIINQRVKKPFLEWSEFNRFCDGLVSDGLFGRTDSQELLDLARAKEDLIKANANPNTLFNKFNPDRIIYRELDKSDMISYTTEFCFAPGGCFEIESLGMVFRPVHKEGKSNKLNAADTQILESEYLLRSVVEVFRVYNETSQNDFDRGMIAKAKKEHVGIYENKTLVTYPEPPAAKRLSDCDGFIGLNNLESKSSSREKVTFQHHFRGLKADYAKGSPDPVTYSGRPSEGSVLTAVNGDTGNIYPDGIYSESGSCPAYAAQDNFVDGLAHEKLYGSKRFRGTVSFWLKPNYRLDSSKPRVIFSLTRPNGVEPDSEYGYQVCQNVFELFAFPLNARVLPQWAGRLGVKPPGQFVWFWEIDESLGNQPDEYIFTHPLVEAATEEDSLAKDPYHNWLHVGIAWDTHPGKQKREVLNCRRCNGTGRIEWYRAGDIENKVMGPCRDCNGSGETLRNFGSEDVYTFCINGRDLSHYAYNQPALFPPEIVHPMALAADNVIRFGEKPDATFWNSSGDFTIDEITIQLNDSVSDAKTHIIDEYKNGRYYKGTGSFMSGEINILPKSKRKDKPKKQRVMASWTVYYPGNWDKAKRGVEVQFLNDDQEPVSEFMSNPQGAEFDTIEQSLRYKIRFRGDSEELNTPLTETPFFDDISIMVFKPSPTVLEQYIIP
ncbi:MAG: hypothetical protein V1701_10545 [Planctomycetota bacterium]